MRTVPVKSSTGNSKKPFTLSYIKKHLMKKFYSLIVTLIFLVSLTSQAQEPKKEEKADSTKKEKSKKKKDLPLEIGRRVPIKTTEGS